MRISDWSSDVCSSDLLLQRRRSGDGYIACPGWQAPTRCHNDRFPAWIWPVVPPPRPRSKQPIRLPQQPSAERPKHSHQKSQRLFALFVPDLRLRLPEPDQPEWPPPLVRRPFPPGETRAEERSVGKEGVST